MLYLLTDRVSEVSRGFGFLRFPDLEKSKAFVESNYPMIYLYGNGSTDSDDQAAKIRIAFSRERDDRNRGEKADGEWICKIVSIKASLNVEALLIDEQCTFVNFPGRTKCFRCQNPHIGMLH